MFIPGKPFQQAWARFLFQIKWTGRDKTERDEEQD